MAIVNRILETDYIVSDDKGLLDVSMVYEYLSQVSYWAKGIPREVVEKSIAYSICFGVYCKDETQVGFARVITDRATFAYLADVFILEGHQGKGLSKWLIEVIQSHPELQGLRRWMLGTKDAHGLYAQFGWLVLDEETRKRFMQRHNKNAYQ
jgi:GNAT superfamily N-acetyltransferase